MNQEARDFWKARRKEMLRRDRRSGGSGYTSTPITLILVALMALSWILQKLVPGFFTLVVLDTGRWGLLLLSTLLPTGLLGLLFSGLFVWVIGSSLEQEFTWWQYLLIFFGSGLLSAWILGGISGTLAPYGLAGAYVYLMSRFDYHNAMTWALGLLLINFFLSGFHLMGLIGIAVAFGAGFGLSWLIKRS
ncbi:MAG: hypothetical protein OWS74_08850 [Firmicutes bacterium]|nr:hypothetical protein [Bacillota bacterium]